MRVIGDLDGPADINTIYGHMIVGQPSQTTLSTVYCQEMELGTSPRYRFPCTGPQLISDANGAGQHGEHTFGAMRSQTEP